MQNRVNLGEKQREAFELYKQGKNVFMTGPGGTGKSTLIREIYDHGEREGLTIAVTAMTGQAAQTIGCDSVTIHRWAGVGLCKGTREEIIHKTLQNTRARKRWMYTECLVIDEVSMMSREMFEVLDKLGRAVTESAPAKYRKYRPHRNPTNPFGGLQLVFSGDFFQLPPVEDSAAFCFTSPIWFETFRKENHVLLDILYRQSGSQTEFRKMLNLMREGKLTPKSLEALRKRVISPPEDKVIPQLYPKKKDIERVNNQELERLSGPLRTYSLMKDEVPNISSMMTDTTGKYKLGVSCDANYLRTSYIKKKDDDTSQFVYDENIRREEENDRIEEEFKRRYEMCGEDDDDDARAAIVSDKLKTPKLPMLRRYVEFTRKDVEEEYKDLEQKVPIPSALHLKTGAHVMCVINITKEPTSGDPGYQLYNGCQGKVVDINNGLPVVSFNGIEALITMEKHKWSSEKIPGVSFSGIPLILSWAMTIHKSQGSTLDAAIIDLGPGVFAVGQSYVGLSRVRTLEGVYLTAFSDKGVKASPKVRAFYEDLKNTLDVSQRKNTCCSGNEPTISRAERREVNEEIECEVYDISPNAQQQEQEQQQIEPSAKQASNTDIRKFFNIPAKS